MEADTLIVTDRRGTYMFENPYVTYVAWAGTVATILMVIGMLSLVIIAANDDRHRPNEKAEEALELESESTTEPATA